MRTEELRQLPDTELLARLDETKEELFNLRFQHATGQLENYRTLAVIKRTVARIETVLHERELGILAQEVVSEKTRLRRLKRAERVEEEADSKNGAGSEADEGDEGSEAAQVEEGSEEEME